MSSSETEIANRAVTKLGDERLLSLSDDTNAGRVMNSMFAQVRDAELRRARWKFAIKRTALTALVAKPTFGYQYQYPLPADYIALVQVNDYYVRSLSKNKGPWSVERLSDDSGTGLLTDLPAPLNFRYVSRITDASRFDPLFVECLACKLALEACESLAKGIVNKDGLRQEYKFALISAASADAIENPPDEFPWGSWLDAREGPNTGLTGSDQFPVGVSGFVVV